MSQNRYKSFLPVIRTFDMHHAEMTLQAFQNIFNMEILIKHKKIKNLNEAMI